MSTTNQPDARRFLEALKELLRERGITYAALAESIGCSLPTIKRTLNNPSLSFSRLLEISETAQISFEELYQRADRRRPRHYVFTEEQDDLFAKRGELLTYFFELAMGGKTPKEIARQHDLDERSTILYLAHLTEVGLIKRGKDGGVKLLAEGPFSFAPYGRYARKEHEAFLKMVVSEVLADDPSDTNCVAMLKNLILSERDYKLMISEIEGVLNRFGNLSDQLEDHEQTSPWQIGFASAPAPKLVLTRLPKITS